MRTARFSLMITVVTFLSLAYALPCFKELQISVTIVLLPDDLIILRINPIQVIWAAESLVKGKPTVLAVNVASTFNDRKWVNISVSYDFGSRLYMESGPNGNGVPIDPGTNMIFIPGGPVLNATKHVTQESWLTSFNYLNWSSCGFDDKIVVKLDPLNKIDETCEDNNELIVSAKVEDARGLKILYYPLSYFVEVPVTGERMSLQKAGADTFVKATYPISPNEYVSQVHPFSYYLFKPGDIIELMLFQAVAELVRALSGYDRIVAVVPTYFEEETTWFNKWFPFLSDERMVGYYRMGSTIFAEEKYWTVVAHELGHSYGITGEESETNPPGNLAEGYWSLPSTHPISGKQLKGPIINGFCFMGKPVYQDYGALRPAWICNEHYNYLLKKFQLGQDPESIYLSGFIYRNGTINLDPWYLIPQAIPDIEFGSEGNCSVQFLDQAGELLGHVGFNVSFSYLGVELELAPFFFKTPYPIGTRQIRVIYNGTFVASREVSAHSPVVSVIYPNGGETLRRGQNVTIQWEGNDLDADDLTYTVLYSFDYGITWIPIITNTIETSVNWTIPNETPAGQYIIKVIATDGINTDEDASDPFFVGTHDIIVQNVTFSNQNPTVNETIIIYVTVENKGDFTEIFDVNINYTQIFDPLMGTETVTLQPGEALVLNFTWIPDVAGRYEIKAYTSLIPDDINPYDNMKLVYIYVSIAYTSTSSTDQRMEIVNARGGRLRYMAYTL